MKEKLKTALFLVLVASLLTVLPGLAAPPLELHIESLEFVGSSGEPFTASGAAVDAGLVCGSGTVDDVNVDVHGSSPSLLILDVDKAFHCAGGDTFYLSMVVQLDLTTNDTTARWRITGGTGDYAGLRGNGSLVGTPVDPGISIFDVYDGFVY